MSWDVSILKFSRPYTSVADIDDDEQPQDLGPVTEVHGAVKAVFAEVDFGDAAWGRWESEIGSIEFNIGRENPVQSMMLHVRAEPEVVPRIVELCRANGWRAIDCNDGEFLDHGPDPAKGLLEWAAYRDRVIGRENDD